MARRTQRPPTAGANHLEWLRLVEVSGPFLSLPVLKEALPQGLEADDRDVRAELKAAHAEWSEHSQDRAYHTQWIRFVLGRALEYGPEVLVDGPAIPAKLRVRAALHNETLQPDYAVLGLAAEGERPARLVIQVHEPGTDLERALDGARWKASPLTRMVELLRGSSDSALSHGIVTNGEQWVLVSAPRKGTTTFVTWHASLWFEEKITLQSFRTLLGVRRTLGAADDTLGRLIERSAEHQHDVTIQLGLQVREAIELLVRRIDELDRRSNRAVLAGASEKQVYEAAVTVMMRLVFVFYLEEQADLYFPVAKSTFYQRHYALSPLSATLRAEADRLGPDVLERRSSAWCRLLACFRAIHGGVVHEDMRLPAYGGHLFDPDRFPFLEGRKPGESWRTVQASPLGVDDATVLFVLEALQVLRVRDTGANGAETRRLSFRELGVEQIGNVYESLLDHTAKRAADAVVSLKGPKGEESEIELRELEQCYDAGDPSKLVSFVKEKTGRSEPSITKDLEYEIEDDSARWLVACGNDRELYGRVKPVAGLVREDRRQQPAVYPKGSVYVTAGADRRSTGTHYTPPSLTEPVVRYALEPLVYVGPAEGLPETEWNLRTPREILALRVCDLACGSGAFLVQACRYLSERLVEAWQMLEDSNPGRLLVSPLGDLSEGRTDERVISPDVGERLAIARRAVIDRCLYGVDVNPEAIEMAKLSLWLITLQRDRPFTFLDHAVKCGDALLGVSSVQQIENFSLRPGERQSTFATAKLSTYVQDAAVKRRALKDLPSDNCTEIETKSHLHAAAQAATSTVRALADCLTALELQFVDSPSYEDQRVNEAEQLQDLMARRRSASSGFKLSVEAEQSGARSSLDQLREHARAQLGLRRPFHWPVEFPEVFACGGFSAFVGNPPFMGGKKITGNLGTDYRTYLVNTLASGARGNADLCTYFFLRARVLLCSGGYLGLISTNSIAQGDTREVGLDQLVDSGCVLVRAIRSRRWPGDASLEVSNVWMRLGVWNGAFYLDDRLVIGITPYLAEGSRKEQSKPQPLDENKGHAFIGVVVYGEGFVLSIEQAEALITKDVHNKAVVLPYLNGEDLNSNPDLQPQRYVIDFGDRTLDEARQYPDCFDHIERTVRAFRQTVGEQRMREKWWLHQRPRPAMRKAIAALHRVLVTARISPSCAIAFVPNQSVFNDKLVVFPFDQDDAFAVLQSEIHWAWVRHFTTTLGGTTLSYSPSDCVLTFPFVQRTSLTGEAACPLLSRVGAAVGAHRAAMMRAGQEGLTATYNRFHDTQDRSESIERLRALHMEMDRAVASAYGWGELILGHGFHDTKQGVRYTICEVARRTLIDRLLALNKARFDEELRRDLRHKQSAAGRSGPRPTPSSGRAPQGNLAFGGSAEEEGDVPHGG